MESTCKKDYIEWLDLAKVIGVYLMIVGHQNLLNQQPTLWIFSFHMPLFFFLSGITFSRKHQGVALGKIIRSLIVPFLILSCFRCFYYIACYFKNGIPIQSIYPYIIGTFLCPGKEFYGFHPLCIYLWFLLALALIKAVSTLIMSNKIMVVVGILSFIVAQLLKKFGIILPLAIDSALLAYPFFIVGYLLKGFLIKRYHSGNIALMLILMTLFTIFIGLNNGRVDINNNLSGNNPFLFLVCGLSGSLMIITLSILITSKLKL